MKYSDDTKYKGEALFSISELMEIFYGESIHVCPDEIEASLLARSALDDFLKIYSSYVFKPA